jgi:hypothetical protein
MGVHYHKAVSSKHHSQGVPQHAPYVEMSQEACLLLNVHCHKAALPFQQDINNSHKKPFKTAANIAEKHGKSMQNVQFDLHSGHSGLTHQHQNKTSPWNAWVWKQAQESRTGISCSLLHSQ